MKPDFTIPGGLLGHMPVFVAVAEHRSFTAGARSLGISASAASQAIARVERALGVALLVRTSRSVGLTRAGARLLSAAGPSVGAMAGAMAELRAGRHEPAGTLRLNVVRFACRAGLPPVLAELARRHPHLRSEVVVDNRPIDIVDDGFDAGVRVKEAVRSEMVRTRLTGPIRMVVAGSRSYLRSRGRPEHPRDLVRHACLGWRSFSGRGETAWAFREGGRVFHVSVRGPVVGDDAELLVRCAEEGMGLAYVAEPEARLEVAAGRLETVLDAFSTTNDGLFLYYPRSARDVANVRALVACVRAVADPGPP